MEQISIQRRVGGTCTHLPKLGIVMHQVVCGLQKTMEQKVIQMGENVRLYTNLNDETGMSAKVNRAQTFCIVSFLVLCVRWTFVCVLPSTCASFMKHIELIYDLTINDLALMFWP